jgi:hypothetical protein
MFPLLVFENFFILIYNYSEDQRHAAEDSLLTNPVFPYITKIMEEFPTVYIKNHY